MLLSSTPSPKYSISQAYIEYVCNNLRLSEELDEKMPS